MIRLFDTHCHLAMKEFQRDLPEVLLRARESDVHGFICVGFNFRSSAEALDLSKKEGDIYAAVGVHPHDARLVSRGDYSFLEGFLKDPKVVAYGEIGLDYYRDLTPRPYQKEVFRQQIAIARKYNLPLIIHDRQASEDVLHILREEKAQEVGGVMHCFSASWREAKEALDLGFYISFAGNITYPSSEDIRRTAELLPQDRLLVETDCPYLRPLPDRRGRNEPAFVQQIFLFLAQLRKEEPEELALKIWHNTNSLFLRSKTSP